MSEEARTYKAIEPKPPKPFYLGDSVYVEEDKGRIKLTTNNGYSDDPRNVIYLEPEIFSALMAWVKGHPFGIVLEVP